MTKAEKVKEILKSMRNEIKTLRGKVEGEEEGDIVFTADEVADILDRYVEFIRCL